MKAFRLTALFTFPTLGLFGLPASAQEPGQAPAAAPAPAGEEPGQAPAPAPAPAAEEPGQRQAAEEEPAAPGPGASTPGAPPVPPPATRSPAEVQDASTAPLIRFQEPLPAAPPSQPVPAAPPEAEGARQAPRKAKNTAPLGGAMRVGIDLTGVRSSDESYELFNDTNLSFRPGVHVGFDLLELAPGWMLAPEVGGRLEVADKGTRMPELLGKELTDLEGFLAVKLRTRLLSFLEAYGRAEGGVGITRVTFRSDGWPGESYESSAVAPGFQFGGGLSLAPPSREPDGQRTKLGLGLNLEGGYHLAPALDLGLARADTPSSQRFVVAGADLGTLSRSGPYLKASGFLRF